MQFVKLCSILLVMAVYSFAGSGQVSYTLSKDANPTADQLDAYAKITIAMDSALSYYNTYTTIRKSLNIQYNTGVNTADGNINGTIRFGSNRSYMSVITAMHEIAHTVGVGTSSEYSSHMSNGIFTGPLATATLRLIAEDNTAELHGDAMHIWPYGLNYASEVKSTTDLVNHANIMESLYQDLYHERVFFTGRIRAYDSKKCMTRNGSKLELGSCADSSSLMRIIEMGETTETYRMEFGDRVLDVPNQSTVSGITLGLYTWNGGSNQKFNLEYQTSIAPQVVRLNMVQSNLYVQDNGTNIIQDAANASLTSQHWELMDATTNTTIIPRHLHQNSLPRPFDHRYDLLGRKRLSIQ